MKRVLVVWQEIPENTGFISLNTDNILQLKRFHNKYINSEETSEEIINELLEFFYNSEGYLKFPLIETILENQYFDLIILTGLIC